MVVALRKEKIKKILARKNMSQNAFAFRIGVSSGYMSQLMSGIRNPSPLLRERLLTVLKLDENNFDKIFRIRNTNR
ncbi:MAG: helix-turn-helix transcriptional regulator [Nitrospirae bacterium]|nr:helix-turn-helix transcriptional regulator [Nitrospirota bacterium]